MKVEIVKIKNGFLLTVPGCREGKAAKYYPDALSLGEDMETFLAEVKAEAELEKQQYMNHMAQNETLGGIRGGGLLR